MKTIDGMDLDALEADICADSLNEQEQLQDLELQEYPANDITPLPAGSGYIWQGPDPQLLQWWDSLTPSYREELSGLHPGDVLSRSVTAALTAGGLTCPQTIRVIGGSAVRMSIASRAAVATIQQVRMAHSTRITGHGTFSH